MAHSAPTQRNRLPRGPLASVSDQLAAIAVAREESDRSAKELASLRGATKVFDRRQWMRGATSAWLRSWDEEVSRERVTTATLEAATEQLERACSENEAAACAQLANEMRLAAENRLRLRHEEVLPRLQHCARGVKQLLSAPSSASDAEQCARRIHETRKALEQRLQELRDAANSIGLSSGSRTKETSLVEEDSRSGSFSDVREQVAHALLQTVARIVPKSDDTSVANAVNPLIETSLGAAMAAAENFERRLRDNADAIDETRRQLADRKIENASLSETSIEILALAFSRGMAGTHGEGLPHLAGPDASCYTPRDLIKIARLRVSLDEITSARELILQSAANFTDAATDELAARLQAVIRQAAFTKALTQEHHERLAERERRVAVLDSIKRQREEATSEARAQEAECMRAHLEEQRRKAQAEELRRKQRKDLLEAWERLRSMQQERNRPTEEEQAAEELAHKQARLNNAMRVAARKAKNDEREAMKLQRAESEAVAREEHRRALQHFYDAVNARLGVAFDPDRVKMDTHASRRRVAASDDDTIPSKRERGAATLHGFTDDDLRRDARSRIIEALISAGLASTPYAHAVLRGMSHVGAVLRTSPSNTLAHPV